MKTGARRDTPIPTKSNWSGRWIRCNVRYMKAWCCSVQMVYIHLVVRISSVFVCSVRASATYLYTVLEYSFCFLFYPLPFLFPPIRAGAGESREGNKIRCLQ